MVSIWCHYLGLLCDDPQCDRCCAVKHPTKLGCNLWTEKAKGTTDGVGLTSKRLISVKMYICLITPGDSIVVD